MKMKIIDFLKDNYLVINLTILTLFIVLFIFSYRIWQLYEPQATIVLHDYGQVFESEIDWKIWRLEHEGK